MTVLSATLLVIAAGMMKCNQIKITQAGIQIAAEINDFDHPILLRPGEALPRACLTSSFADA